MKLMLQNCLSTWRKNYWRTKNERLKSELNFKKDLIDRLNRSQECIKSLDGQLRTQRWLRHTFGLTYTEQGEPSNKFEKINMKTNTKKKKLTCYHCEKPRDTKNVCRRKNGKRSPTPI